MTKSSKYLLNQEHATDREIDELYALARELTTSLDEFKALDVQYRALEEVNTVEAEAERVALNNASFPIFDNLSRILKEFQDVEKRIYDLLIKAQGALEEKLESER